MDVGRERYHRRRRWQRRQPRHPVGAATGPARRLHHLDLDGSLPQRLSAAARRDDQGLGVAVSILSGTGPLALQVCPVGATASYSQSLTVTASANAWLPLDKTVNPPVNGGNYVVSLCNLGPDTVTVSNWASVVLDPNGAATTLYTSTGAVSIADAALTTSFLDVNDSRKVVSAQVGVRIDHPRVSDLVLHLISPSGTRVLLDENRGGQTTAGMGIDVITTNTTVVLSNTNDPENYTNIFSTGQTSGSITVSYQMFDLPDELRIYHEGSLIYDSGWVTGAGGPTNITYGPGTATNLTMVLTNTHDQWNYTVIATNLAFGYLTFTEDTNLTLTPIKFAIPPFTNDSPAPGGGPANGIFYLAEESLGALAGETALGHWRLEIEDTQAGPAGATATLLSWQLALCLADTVPVPIPLVHHQRQTNTVAAGAMQCYAVDVPAWANFATNTLLSTTAPLSLLFNSSQSPSVHTNLDGSILLFDSTGGSVVLASGTPLPAITPGVRYYLAVRNTNPVAVTFAVEVDFDVPVLTDGVPLNVALAADSQPRYFSYDPSPNATLVVFQLQNLSANADLYAEYGLPFPLSDGTAEYWSTNPNTNDEQIDVFTNSVPVPLSTGRWYLGVFNADITNVAGTLLAREFTVYGTNVALVSGQISGNALCLSWASTPGLYYNIVGATNLNGQSFVQVSRTVVASDYQTTFCAPLASPLQTFVVLAGPAPGGDLTPPSLGAVNVTTTGIQLLWTAGTNRQFQVQWSPSLSPSAWATIPGAVTSPSGAFSFLDDGSQTGGLDSARFYRLLVVP